MLCVYISFSPVHRAFPNSLMLEAGGYLAWIDQSGRRKSIRYPDYLPSQEDKRSPLDIFWNKNN